MSLRIGIDIGASGAIAFFKDGKLSEYYAFPKSEDRPDLRTFCEMLLDRLNGENNVHAVIEDLHSIFGTSAKSNFQFGWINGAMEAILTAFSVPYTKVQAKKWQKEMWEGIRPVEIKVKQKEPDALNFVRPLAIPVSPGLPLEEDFDMDRFLNEDSGLSNAVPAEPKKKPRVKIDTKATSLIAAKRLFPDEKFLATTRSKVPHNGVIDAVLIGEYCRRNF
jgi:hypothetical protein